MNKPWVMYSSSEEIGQAIQKGLTEKLKLPVGMMVENDQFLIVVRLGGNDAHIRVSLEDLKSLHNNVEEFISFIDECWQESIKQ